MMSRMPAPRGFAQLLAMAAGGFVVGLLLTKATHTVALAESRSPLEPQAQQAAGQGHAASTRVFASDAGVILNFIKSDKTEDFEEIVARLREALQKSERPERKQQAESWKVFRAVESGANGSVLYVFAIDPAVKGADYTVSTILAEAFPDEVQALYKKYAESYASGQNFVNLSRLADTPDASNSP